MLCSGYRYKSPVTSITISITRTHSLVRLHRRCRLHTVVHLHRFSLWVCARRSSLEAVCHQPLLQSRRGRSYWCTYELWWSSFSDASVIFPVHSFVCKRAQNRTARHQTQATDCAFVSASLPTVWLDLTASARMAAGPGLFGREVNPYVGICCGIC